MYFGADQSDAAEHHLPLTVREGTGIDRLVTRFTGSLLIPDAIDFLPPDSSGE